MTISVIDLFSVGIGPSSSHTVGPMRAAQEFVSQFPHLPDTVDITLRGSLAATGKGHGTDRAVILGLVGYLPETLEPDVQPAYGDLIPEVGQISGPLGTLNYRITIDVADLPEHPNGVIFQAFDSTGSPLCEPTDYYSVGGGFILSGDHLRRMREEGEDLGSGASTTGHDRSLPFPFRTAAELKEHCRTTGMNYSGIMAHNESTLHGGQEVVAHHLAMVWNTMQECVRAGMKTSGILPGGLGVTRRAPGLLEKLKAIQESPRGDALGAMEWVNLYALAVNEENAAGGKVVTAPTNGAAGIIPAVMHYALDFLGDFSAAKAQQFLLAAGAVGIIIKENASISGAEVGCQGEVGSAAAMAAAGLCEILGGSASQVENAAEIALEHNLGLTCDPVGGLVQIPCIERNAIGAVKAINAARLALMAEGINRVTLDEVVETMARTGKDMLSKYKETAAGGLAVTLGLPVNLTEC
ncbi:L-serine ammonia-lyase [Corynebacterium poyangense]|uniref:L-serine dehydratase n=1 Tax=Corynebacterium poyangense TaxID=2684405 RepID=A0A7H0SP42_9CORY|nr:L-serine ammonia-lyase [Corynebacterium poyangense]MBZ8177885.1 L-serine ammonia-lyase [Corynebacterium poyangense]QNQ90317.1 L-serine ammonia-lyase [Corynebacterium poyangense]